MSLETQKALKQSVHSMQGIKKWIMQLGNGLLNSRDQDSNHKSDFYENLFNFWRCCLSFKLNGHVLKGLCFSLVIWRATRFPKLSIVSPAIFALK